MTAQILFKFLSNFCGFSWSPSLSPEDKSQIRNMRVYSNKELCYKSVTTHDFCTKQVWDQRLMHDRTFTQGKDES